VDLSYEPRVKTLGGLAWYEKLPIEKQENFL
jgi:hypothetical protein